MSTASLMITALLVTLLAGSAATAWLWRIYCRQLVVAGGLRALAAMRWREFSRFVVEALQAQGFNASRLPPDADRGQDADLLLTKGSQIWLLSCKQGVNYRITTDMVGQLARAVHGSDASGGILATLGRIPPAVRKQAQGIELIDGATLWPLIDPLLPPSLHQDLASRARSRTVRATVLAWVAALLFGVGAAATLSTWPTSNGRAGRVSSAPSPTATTQAPPATTDSPAVQPPATPGPETTEDESVQRSNAAAQVSALPGIERASWATRSTMVALLQTDADDTQVERICATLRRNGIHTARLQLQPPSGSESPVRFLQCQVKD